MSTVAATKVPAKKQRNPSARHFGRKPILQCLGFLTYPFPTVDPTVPTQEH
jgi:hypothetical protein